VALIDGPTILVLRALGLGDLLTAVPALRALRRAFPSHRVVLAAPESLAPLVRLARFADELHPTAGLSAPAWSGPVPELAVNLHGRGPQSHALLAGLQPGRLVAFDCPPVGHRGPRWDENEHEVRRWCRLLTEDLGVVADPGDLALARPAGDALVSDAVVVHPGAAFGSRRWPAERFAGVARWARMQGHPVVVTGVPDELPLARRVQRLAGLDPGSVLAGRTDLTGLTAVVHAARLVVSGDTGVAHLATACATPSVVLFGPTPPSRWGPPSDGPHAVIWHGRESGDPWADDVDPALLEVTVDEVVSQAALMLGSPGSRRGSRTTRASV
jgi:ADP-heptose:LPS heptosyltransferase